MKKNFLLWVLLSIFISFDNIFSYFAIAEHGMREGNPITGFFVSISPFYYFLSIPLTLLFIYLLINFAGWITEKTSKPKKYNLRELTEKLTLACIVIAWSIGISLFNFLTLIRGFSPLGIRYEIFLGAGILAAFIYALYIDYKLKEKFK